ncbi:hypothetical protein HK101_009951 [Irineochytrium annulatum]|nr:hypothetical protein HK101_009951 [Irineochytrium annulatum]
MRDAEAMQFSTEKDSYLIGRTSQAGDRSLAEIPDFMIEGKFVSGQHCRVFRMKDEFGDWSVMVEDLSSNGTYVNRKRVGKKQRTLLSHGNEVSFGLTQITGHEPYYIFQAVTKPDEPVKASPFEERFDVRNEIGRGNFSIVKMAVDKETGEKCAVKVIEKRKYLLNSKILTAFTREVEILQSLDHPNIVGFRNYFEEDGLIYLVQELITGGDLLAYVNKRGRLSEKESCGFLCQMVDVLEYLLERQITHRDLKPDNFLITEGNVLKLADFGLAKGFDVGVLNTVCGTPIYLAPEVIFSKGKAYDHRVDIYSTGVILFYLLSGQVPFDGESQNAVYGQIKAGAVDWSDEIWKKTSSEAIDLIQKLMEREPNRRIELREIRNHPWVKCGGVAASLQRQRTLVVSEDDAGPAGFAKLVLEGGDSAAVGNVIELSGAVVNIGRIPTNEVVLTDRRISSKHCQIVFERGVVSLIDMSRNGMAVNGVSLVKNVPTVLNGGDLIRLAPRIPDSPDTPGLPDLVYRVELKKRKREGSPTSSEEEREAKKMARNLRTPTLEARRYRLVPIEAQACPFQPSGAQPLPPKGSCVFGRAPSCNVRVEHLEVSGTHCRVICEDGRVMVEDMSTNGTYVNGKKIGKKKSVEITEDDEVILAKPKVGFRLELAVEG